MTTATVARAASRPAARKAAGKPKAKPVAPATLDRFGDALPLVLVHEGGKVDHPKDPGGRTNRGITQRVFSAWLARTGKPNRDVYTITEAEVRAIYREQYWDVVQGDALPAGVGYVVFDGAVNSGPRQSVKWLQRALGPLYDGKVDGVVGSITLQAVQMHPDHDALIAGICERRMIFLQALKTWAIFRKGWTARVADVLAAGQAWASGTVPSPAEYRAGGAHKADIEDARDGPPPAPGDVAAGGGVATAGGGGLIETARQQLEPYVAKAAWLGTIVVWLVIAGIVVAAAGAGYRWWAARERAKLADALDLEG